MGSPKNSWNSGCPLISLKVVCVNTIEPGELSQLQWQQSTWGWLGAGHREHFCTQAMRMRVLNQRESTWLLTPLEHFNFAENFRNYQIRRVEICVYLTNLNYLPETHPKATPHSLVPHQSKKEIVLLQTFSGTAPFCSLNDFKGALPQSSVCS